MAGVGGRQPLPPEVVQRRGVQVCLTIKCPFGPALRQAMGVVESLLKRAGLDWTVPDYGTVCPRQQALPVTVSARPSPQGLPLVVIKMLGEGEWKTKKHDGDYRPPWRTVHLGIDAQTPDSP